jgi:ion channel
LNWFAVILGFGLILLVLWEAFETIVLPRRVTRHFRLTRLFYRWTWLPLRSITGVMRNKKKRDRLLSYYGPMSLLLLFAFWAMSLVLGFALIHFGDGARFSGAVGPNRFGTAVYLSGTTFFTLGLGDVTPASPLGRFVTVAEGGIGFGFLALVIGYLPVLYQSFSRREVTISLLDARAGSPPTAFELLRRHSGPNGMEALTEVLQHWEQWSAELMESHLSYPVLAYFRSQHDNESWISSLTAVLDTCALAMVGLEGMCQYQARMTFAIARHALVDLSQVFRTAPDKNGADGRLSPEDLALIRQQLTAMGFQVRSDAAADAELTRLRGLYEPYAMALARFLALDLPPWVNHATVKDNWQTTAWAQRQMQVGRQRAAVDEH